MSEEILAEWTATDDEGDGGLPYVPPLAQYGAERDTVPGLLAGIEIVAGLTRPEVRDGMMRMPATTQPEDGEPSTVPLAQFNNPYQGNTAGLLAGIDVREGVDAPFVEDGVAVLTLAHCLSSIDSPVTGLIAGAECDTTRAVMEIENGVILYPQWALLTTVQELEKRITELESNACTCSITLADIEAAISEQLGAISWQMETSGLLEQNEHGRLNVTTTGTGGVDGGAAETQVGY